jgi:ATP-dependent DNA helicase DinG
MRPNQREVMDAIERNWDTFNYIFLEAPTGFGKSAVVYAVAKWLLEEHGLFTHFLVSDIYLQTQYLRDFKDISLIKGRSNYTCSVAKANVRHFFEDSDLYPEYPTCGEAPCTLTDQYGCYYKPKHPKDGEKLRDKYGTIFLWDGVEQPYCQYWLNKDIAIHNPLTIHNYPYLLNEMLYSHSFNDRELCIMDEAHTIENTLMSFVEVNINSYTLNRITQFFEIPKIKIPYYKTINEWFEWIKEINNELTECLKKYGTSEQVMGENVDVAELRVRKLTEALVEKLDELITNIEDDPDNWVWTIPEDKKNDHDAIIFKPVRVSQYGKDLLFKHTKKHILISATILDSDKMKAYLGIDEDVRFLRVHESNFPVQNRPFYIRSQGKATSETKIDYLPKMLDYIDDVLLPKLIKDKGVIHSHTNDTARYILTNSKYKNIMMSNVDVKGKRNDVFESFFKAPKPCVMVTPSMRLGVDLKDDLARWQIIAKVPYPYLGDPQVKKRTEIDSGWYEYQTITSLIQTYGRVCRSETDYGETYILDGKFDDIFFRNINYFPRWFKEAIRR